MGAKPWHNETSGRQLEAFLGSRGIRTSDFSDTTDLMIAAATLFEINISDCATMAAQIAAMSLKQRKALFDKNARRIREPRDGEDERALPAPPRIDLSPEVKRALDAPPDQKLVPGEWYGCAEALDIDPNKLLHKVVMAVINAGQAQILWEFPDVLAYFRARMPARNAEAATSDKSSA